MERNFNFWAYIYQAPDLPGVWVAHCLRLDLVSQGDSPAGARDAIHEAVEMALLDDLNCGLEPLERRPAPDECWTGLRELQEIGRGVNIGRTNVAEVENVSRFAVMLQLSFSPAAAAERVTLAELAAPADAA